MPWLLYLYDSLNMRQGGPKASQNALQKSPMLLSGADPQFLSCSACSLATIMTMLSQYMYVYIYIYMRVCMCQGPIFVYSHTDSKLGM